MSAEQTAPAPPQTPGAALVEQLPAAQSWSSTQPAPSALAAVRHPLVPPQKPAPHWLSEAQAAPLPPPQVPAVQVPDAQSWSSTHPPPEALAADMQPLAPPQNPELHALSAVHVAPFPPHVPAAPLAEQTPAEQSWSSTQPPPSAL